MVGRFKPTNTLLPSIVERTRDSWCLARAIYTHRLLAKDGTIDIEKTKTYASLLKQRSIAPGKLFHAQKVVTVDKYLTPDAPKVKTAGFIPLTGEVADTSSFYEVWSALTDSQRYLLAVAALKNPGQYAKQSNEDSVDTILTAVAVEFYGKIWLCN